VLPKKGAARRLPRADPGRPLRAWAAGNSHPWRRRDALVSGSPRGASGGL